MYWQGTGLTLLPPLVAHFEELALLNQIKLAKVDKKCNQSFMYFGEDVHKV